MSPEEDDATTEKRGRLTMTTVEAKSILGKHGFKPVIYVYENNKYLWKQSEPVYFVHQEHAIECAQRMRNEILAQWAINNKAVA